ncbi:uncharacterized protein LOC110853101 isoform X2 [Folsomia candida]|uniref:Phospholipid scramblase n=1 Tax=Folsomia candida TaxID=158441 RepID=A0A226DZZ5_FOLCA|nr:uncharacterized protein LOC110853101 isoform X2 [Folsomia candida]OXA50873.1 Phospholipid scramblase 1 [Folsomia candida]
MEDPLIANCEIGGTTMGSGNKGGDEEGDDEEVKISDVEGSSSTSKSRGGESSSSGAVVGNKSPSKSRARNHVVHPLSGGAINCLLAVDGMVRATADLGTPRKISLATPGFSVNVDGAENEAALYLPLQNTRHLFIREYKKPQWPTAMQATRRFQILNSTGDCIYFAAERSSFLSRILFLRGIFPYDVNVLSMSGEKIMEIQCRPFLNNCMTIKDSRGELMGKIRKENNWCNQSYSLRTWDGTEILNILGPDGSNCCLFADCGGDDFEVNLGIGTTPIGKISAEWEYALENLCGVFVPMKLDELTMSLLLGAVFLIDFNFYQRRRDASCFGRCFMTFALLALFILLLFLIAKK